MANMTFKANLLPNTDLGYSLGDSSHRWNIFLGATEINRQKYPNINNSVESGNTPLDIPGLKNGYPVYDDTCFAKGTNSVQVYNNAGGGTVTITRMTAADAGVTPGNGSDYVLKIQSAGTATPGIGGFYQSISSRANAVFIQIFRALIPVGRNVQMASNSMGDNYKENWLTSQAGTGKWEWYARIVHCGKTGSFSNGGHVYLDGAATTSSAPVVWYLSECNVYDLTKGNYQGLRVRHSDAVLDYNNGNETKFGYSTSGMTSTSWLGSWDGYNLRAISPANAVKSALGTSAIGAAGTPIYWNGSSFVAGTAAASSGHTHNYLPLSGGTMTGVLTLKGSLYEDSYTGALNANNSNIYNLNSIYTADVSDGASEGIHFYRDSTHVDSLWANGGDLLFVPNRALGTTTTKENSQKVARFTANPTSGQVVITDGTTGGIKSSGYTIAASVPSGAKFTDNNTTYTFAGGNGSFTVTPSGGSAQTISIGKPATAGTADQLGTATVGGSTQPIYLNAGVPTAATSYANATVGTADKLTGFSSRSTSMGWGNQTGSVLTCLATPAGGGLGFRDNNPASGQTSMTIDGTVYIKEGNVSVGDAIKSITRSGTTFTYTTLWGNTGTFTQQDNNTTYTFAGGNGSFTVTPSGGTAQTVSIGKPATAGTADVAGKLGSSTIGSSTLPIYLNNGTPTAISSIQDETISWGGANLAGSTGVVDTLLNNQLRPNRFSGFKPAGTTIEYSTDGGSSWTDYGASDAQKLALFTTSTGLRLVPSGNVTNNSQLRITMDTMAGGCYTQINKIMIYVSTNYSNGCKVTIDASLGNDPTNFSLKICENQPISGWSGWNVINKTFVTYGNTSSAGSQYGKIRFTFKHDSITSGREANGLNVYCIYGYGGVGWNVQNNLARSDHAYTYDQNLNVTFPGTVSATGFSGNANSATALKDRTNGALTYSNYGAAGLAASAITWLTCWNGYELRAISKDEMANAVDGAHKWVRLTGDTVTGALNTANNTWNSIGDDVQIGDINEAGTLGIQGKNGNTALRFTTYNQTTKTTGGKLTWNGTVFQLSHRLDITGLLTSTANSNTVTIGSQNSSWTHIYNSANIPFIFNNSIQTTTGNLGSTSYPFNNLYIGATGNKGIYYVGTKATNQMITFLDNTNDTYGNGIKIGGGGTVVVGAGESAANLSATAGTENAYLLADGITYVYSTADTIANRRGFRVENGNVIPTAAESNSDNTYNLGASGVRWANAYITTVHGALDGNANTATTANRAIYSASANYALNASRLNGQGRKTTTASMALNPSTDTGFNLTWNIFDSSSRTADANAAPSFDAGAINIPWDWGAYNGQIAITNTSQTPRMQIRSASHKDNGESANPRYTPQYGAWREVVTANKATQMGNATKPIYISNTGQVVEGTALGASAYHADNYFVTHLGNAGKSNMNDVGRLHSSSGMTNLTDPSNNTDNPMNGSTKSTGWHLYWDTNYSDDPNGSNSWVAQIVNKAGTTQWWVRSRGGSTITNGTAWAGDWHHLVVSPQAGQGGTTTPVYIDANGHTQSCTSYANASVNYATSAGSASYAASAGSASSATTASWAVHAASATYAASAGAATDSTKLPLAGGIMTGQIQKASVGKSWYQGRDGALIRNTTATYTSNQYNPIMSVKSINGTWDVGTYTTNNSLYFSYVTDTNYNAGTNATSAQIEFRGSDQKIYATGFVGTLTGNASSATTASQAVHAASATYAASAGSASSATTASQAVHAASAAYATSASTADNVTGVVAIAHGGTGKTTVLDAYEALESRGSASNLNDALGRGVYSYNNSSTNTPVSGRYGAILNVINTGASHNNTNNQIWQYATDTSSNNLYIRRKVNSGAWTGWTTQLNSDNYTSYTVTKTGTGASGTWPISISGNAATAGSAGITTTANVAVSSWGTHTEAVFNNAGYTQRASIGITNCNANHYPSVTFTIADAISGIFAPVAQSVAGAVYIYARTKPTAVTPVTIKLT